jgi:hypothetical protein
MSKIYAGVKSLTYDQLKEMLGYDDRAKIVNIQLFPERQEILIRMDSYVEFTEFYEVGDRSYAPIIEEKN